MKIYKLHNRFGYRTTSIIRFACHNISPLKKNKIFKENFIIPITKPITHFILTNKQKKILIFKKKKNYKCITIP